MKKFVFILLVVFLIFLGTIGVSFYRLSHYQSPQTLTVEFKRGESLKGISLKLEQAQVISNAAYFEWMARLQGEGGKLKAGEYEFRSGITPARVLNQMVLGAVKVYSVTIPEGFNLREIGEFFSKKGLTTPSRWQQLIRDPELIQSLNIPISSLEGYLFPETYLYEKRATDKDLVKKMISVFKDKVTPSMIQEAKAQGFSLHQWVTLASIIEKETAVPKERPLIASVFLNRLQKGISLQTDPTVIYGLSVFDGNLTREHLKKDNPYNTYTRSGLPPGPICSPGLESLRAVLFPAKTHYLYFVSKGDGSHYFSETLDQHNQAVRHYQLKRGTPPL